MAVCVARSSAAMIYNIYGKLCEMGMPLSSQRANINNLGYDTNDIFLQAIQKKHMGKHNFPICYVQKTH